MRAGRAGAAQLVLAGLAGASWGLGLARLMAEAGLFVPLYISPWAVGAVAAAASAGVLLAHRFFAQIPPKIGPVLPLFLPLLYVLGIVDGPLAGCVLVVGGAALAVLLATQDRAPWLVPAILGLATFILYLKTLLPSLGEADTFEFQVVVPRLAVAHPTGYPLYTLISRLFTLLPLSTVAWRVSLASAVYATGAVLVLYTILIRLTGRRLPSFLASLTFASSSVFWSQAIVAEVYALHALLIAAMLLLLIERPHWQGGSGAGSSHEGRRWYALALLLGLSMANHLTTALLLPAVALTFLLDRPRLRPRQWLVSAALVVLGLSVYAFIPLRWPALNNGELMTVRGFIEHVTGGQFHRALRVLGLRDPVRWSIVGRLIREPFGWIGLALAACGLAALARRRRRALAITGITFLAFFAYGLAYHVPDVSVFLIPAHLVLAIWIGAGIAVLTELVESRFVRFGPAIGQALVVVLALVPFGQIYVNLPAVDQSQTPRIEAWGREVLRLPLALGSAILADVKKFAPLYYVQQIEGSRPDIDIVLLGSEAEYQEALAARLAADQTVYLARYLPNLEHLRLRSVGPLVEVSPRPLPVQHDPDNRLEVLYGSAIRLLGYDEISVPADGRGVRLALHWVADETPQQDYVVRFRLRDEAGAVAWESQGVRPVAGLYPTSAWRPGEVVVDFHELALPTHVGAGTYAVEVGLFPRFADNGLPVNGRSDSWAPLGDVPVGEPARTFRLGQSAPWLFGRSLWLADRDVPSEAAAGAPVDVTLWWRGETLAGATGDASLVLTWWDESGSTAGQMVSPAALNVDRQRAFQTRRSVQAPEAGGGYDLRAGWVDGFGAAVPARCGWLRQATDTCKLGTVQVIRAHQGLANYADLLLLVEAEAGRIEPGPGDPVPVDLRWRALRHVQEDYTLFVQLVGPDGRLHGQVDTWPVQGTYPTSEWVPGEEVFDHHEVRLDGDAPRGRYTIQVGWYLLATMQRLPVVDGVGQPVGDAFVIGHLEVGD